MLGLLSVPATHAQSGEVQRVEPGTLRRIVDPVLPIVFFDSGSAEIPSRYHRYTSSEETNAFVDTTIPGLTALDRYYWIIDVIGYRLRKNPRARITLFAPRGDDGRDRASIAQHRSEIVCNYLTDVWSIPTSRIKRHDGEMFNICVPNQNLESERRAVWFQTDDYEITKPIDRSQSVGAASLPFGPEIASEFAVPLIVFRFDSPEPGPWNLRIIRDMIISNAKRASHITIDGYAAISTAPDRAERLARDRAGETARFISSKLPARTRSKITVRPHRVADSLFTNQLPEGRYLNQAVVVRMRIEPLN
ncbi:MAG: hypothetical protein H7X80_01755 [bacterium]|nr:hypothetical protein [Candidatus Kapabacteria bacterium]